jgi:hypothetical protein
VATCPAEYINPCLGEADARIQGLEIGQSNARMRIHGRGSEIRFQAPWKDVAVRLDGKEVQAEQKDGAVVVRVPHGSSRIEMTPKR